MEDCEQKLMIEPTPGVRWPPRLAALSERLACHGRLTAADWGTFESLLKESDPTAFEKRCREARHRLNLKAARGLSVEDLRMVLNEKTSGS